MQKYPRLEFEPRNFCKLTDCTDVPSIKLQIEKVELCVKTDIYIWIYSPVSKYDLVFLPLPLGICRCSLGRHFLKELQQPNHWMCPHLYQAERQETTQTGLFQTQPLLVLLHVMDYQNNKANSGKMWGWERHSNVFAKANQQGNWL